MKENPFSVSLEQKAKHLLAINETAMSVGANFCSSRASPKQREGTTLITMSLVFLSLRSAEHIAVRYK